MACAMMMGLGACSANNSSDASKSSSVFDASSDDRPVMKINISEKIPKADSNGEIPGAKANSNVKRQTVTFGKYYQSTSGKNLTPLKWIVLDKKKGYSLLMTKQIIESNGWMNESDKGTAWEKTDLRRWLDQDFYNTAFSSEEKKHMGLFNGTQPQNPRYSTSAGKSTVDPVSLLSYQELIHYMPTDKERKTSPTDYAVKRGCYQNPDGDAAWWLRSPGPSSDVPEHLASWGNLGARTHYINDSSIGVRPVIWVESKYLSTDE